MPLDSRNGSLLLLAIAAFPCARAIFAFIAEPEGPNLLVVTGMAAILFVISAAGYLSNLFPSLTGFRRSVAAIIVQIIVAAGFALGLR